MKRGINRSLKAMQCKGFSKNTPTGLRRLFSSPESRMVVVLLYSSPIRFPSSRSRATSQDRVNSSQQRARNGSSSYTCDKWATEASICTPRLCLVPSTRESVSDGSNVKKRTDLRGFHFNPDQRCVSCLPSRPWVKKRLLVPL